MTSGALLFLGIDMRVWNNLHIVTSFAMVGGVLAHLVLHSRWIVSMTRKILASKTPAFPIRSAAEPESIRINDRGSEWS